MLSQRRRVRARSKLYVVLKAKGWTERWIQIYSISSSY
jgi:hypothetical protein